jgi:hypothetical protein
MCSKHSAPDYELTTIGETQPDSILQRAGGHQHSIGVLNKHSFHLSQPLKLGFLQIVDDYGDEHAQGNRGAQVKAVSAKPVIEPR